MGLSAYVLDNGLATMQSEADKLYLCNAEPTTYAEAISTFAVGNKNWGAGNVLTGPTDDATSGRKLTTVTITDGAETAADTARWWAIVDSVNSRLLAVGALTAKVLSGGGPFILAAFDIRMSGVPFVPYDGPGDVVASAVAWWGLRAYSSAARGTNAIRLRRSSDNAEQDFATIAGGGGLDLTAISSFKGADNLFVVTLYDQTGNGFDLTQSTAGNQPPFVLSGLGALPVLTFTRASNHYLFDDTGPNATEPSTFGVVVYTPTNTFLSYNIGGIAGVNIFLQWTGVGSLYLLGTSGNIGPSASVDVWHSLHGIIDGAASDFNVDDTTNTGTVSASGSGRAVIGNVGGGNAFTGKMVEAGYWPSHFSSGQITSMNANEVAYYSQGYEGPGDIVSGATAWWSLRAYSWRTLGNNAIRLRRDSDNAEQDFATIAGGGLDLTAISSFKGAANLFVVTLYDQSGNGHDLTQATAGNQPTFLLNGLGSLPIIYATNIISGSGLMSTSAGFALSAPYSWILVAMQPDGASVTKWQESVTPPIQFNATAFAETWGGYDIGSGATLPVTGDVWHTACNTQTGGLSTTYIDAVGTTGTPFGGGTAMSGAFITGPLRGHEVELGVYPFTISAGDAAALDANQTAYWGF